jgi:hypothetical protein
MNERPKQRFPSWKQALLILAGGIVLALSSCAAFLGTIDSNNKSGIVFAAGFFLGLCAALVGMILVFIRAIRGPASPGPQK